MMSMNSNSVDIFGLWCVCGKRTASGMYCSRNCLSEDIKNTHEKQKKNRK